MNNKKFIKILRTLSHEEFTEFYSYLKVKLHKQQAALNTFKYLKRFHPLFQDKKRLSIAYAYEKIFKQPIESNPSNRKNFLNIISDLNLNLKEFLVIRRINNDSIEGRLIWSTILMERGLNEEFFRKITTLNKELGAISLKGTSTHLYHLMSNYLYYYKVIQKKLEPQIMAIQQAEESLDHFYCTMRIKLACETLARAKLLNTKPPNAHSISTMVPIIHSLKENNHLLAIYYQAYQLLLRKKDEDYNALEALLKKHRDIIPTEDQHILFSYLQNHASSQLRNGKNSFWIKLHELNKFAADQMLFTHKGLISHTQFNNIVNIACKVKAFDWAMEFIDLHEQYVDKSIRLSTTTLARAIIYYKTKNFDPILPLLLQMDFIDTHQAIRAKALTLISYVELNWKQITIISFCKSFSTFLRRQQKINEETIEATQNFIKLTKMVALGHTPKEVLREKIVATKPLYFDMWLLEKTS